MRKHTFIKPHSTPHPSSTNHKFAAAGTGHVEGEGEPDNRRADGLVQSSFTLWLVEYVVEIEQGLVVASVDNRADQDSQANR